ncbi:MAG: hypothetical protein NVSMB9_19890 [Isosphaeraceae bacterium]
MSVASLQPPAVVYHEEQNFDWKVYALAVLIEALMGLQFVWLFQGGGAQVASGPLGVSTTALTAVFALSLPPLVILGLLRMTTEVTPTDLRVWFGWVPTYRRFYGIDAIKRIEVVTYRPLMDYGGWGIRIGRDGERVLNARGNRGVRLELTDGTRLLIGSQSPETLATAIERAMRPGS